MHTATFGMYLFQEGKHMKCQAVFLSFWLLSQDGKKNLVLHSDSCVCLFVCVEVLRPSQPIRAMSKFILPHVFLGRLRPLGN